MMSRSINEIVEECVTNLSCNVVTVNSIQVGLVVRVGDGTCSEVLSVEYRGQDTMTQEEAGNNKHFIDVWVENEVMVDRLRELHLVAGDWIKMEKVKCVLDGEERKEFPEVFRFMLVDGEVRRLQECDVEILLMSERIRELDKTPDNVGTNVTYSDCTDPDHFSLKAKRKFSEISGEELNADIVSVASTCLTESKFSTEQLKKLRNIFREVFLEENLK